MGRIDSFFRPLFPGLRPLPVLNRSNVLATKLLVKFMDSLDELRRHFGRCHGVGFGLWFDLYLRLRHSLGFRLRVHFGYDLRRVLCLKLRPNFAYGYRLLGSISISDFGMALASGVGVALP